MVMADTSIQMVISIQEIGLMENGQAGVNLLINLAKLTKVCGSIVNSWALENFENDGENSYRNRINYQRKSKSNLELK